MRASERKGQIFFCCSDSDLMIWQKSSKTTIKASEYNKSEEL
jgi:hypothetical protein